MGVFTDAGLIFETKTAGGTNTRTGFLWLLFFLFFFQLMKFILYYYHILLLVEWDIGTLCRWSSVLFELNKQKYPIILHNAIAIYISNHM